MTAAVNLLHGRDMDTRTALLDAAENVVRMRGYDGFSYADLAGAVGIRKASIHHHFPAKQDLATAIVARYAARVVQRLDVVADWLRAAGQRSRPLSHCTAMHRATETCSACAWPCASTATYWAMRRSKN